jgi:hypothetical protein
LIDLPTGSAGSVSLDQAVAVTVEKATLDELMERSLNGTGLTSEIKGSSVRIYRETAAD